MDKIIELNDIRMKYRTKEVLSGINLSVAKGEIFGLLGPSGAGKTTILNILTGQLPPTSGEARLFGCNTRCLTRRIYSDIGLLLDNCGLYERLTCYDNLQIYAKIYGLPKSVISIALEKVELVDAIKRPVNMLSKGMAQRLALARAIMNNPKILFLDEPTSGLDPATAQKIHKLIFELRKGGTTIFLTTHNMEEATLLCNEIVLLNEGEIVENGVPKEICRKHNTMNCFNILLKSGEHKKLQNCPETAGVISDYIQKGMLESIHSSEPNLESVFLKLTGRKLV